MACELSAEVEKLVLEQMAAGGYASQEALIRDALEALAARRGATGGFEPEVVGVRSGLGSSADFVGSPYEHIDAEFRSKNKLSFDA